MAVIDTDFLITAILNVFPAAEAMYLFGSVTDDTLNNKSDIDIAVLLPRQTAAEAGSLSFTDVRLLLEDHYQRDVDLINLREVTTVFTIEIIMKGERIFTGNRQETELFEMMALSLYQKLNEERKEIVEDFYRTGKAYNV